MTKFLWWSQALLTTNTHLNRTKELIIKMLKYNENMLSIMEQAEPKSRQAIRTEIELVIIVKIITSSDSYDGWIEMPYVFWRVYEEDNPWFITVPKARNHLMI